MTKFTIRRCLDHDEEERGRDEGKSGAEAKCRRGTGGGGGSPAHRGGGWIPLLFPVSGTRRETIAKSISPRSATGRGSPVEDSRRPARAGSDLARLQLNVLRKLVPVGPDFLN